MVTEATACETATPGWNDLARESIAKWIHGSGGSGISYHLLNTEFDPPGRFFTNNSLMGRHRDPLAVLLPASDMIAKSAAASRQTKNWCSHSWPLSNTFILEAHPEHNRKHKHPTWLLAAWKRVSSHRTAAVFWRSVNPKEAPGYTDRILFSIELHLIRNMISASIIQSLSDLHHHLLLIRHNCVKFNGPGSDDGIVTRDFEAQVEEVLLQLIMNTASTTMTTARTTSPVPPAVLCLARPADTVQPTTDPVAPIPQAAAPTAATSITVTTTSCYQGACGGTRRRPDFRSNNSCYCRTSSTR